MFSAAGPMTLEQVCEQIRPMSLGRLAGSLLPSLVGRGESPKTMPYISNGRWVGLLRHSALTTAMRQLRAGENWERLVAASFAVYPWRLLGFRRRPEAIPPAGRLRFRDRGAAARADTQYDQEQGHGRHARRRQPVECRDWRACDGRMDQPQENAHQC
jgi:hypothetical protein